MTRRGRRLDLDELASSWQHALDAAQHALDASHHDLPGDERARRAQALVAERQETARRLVLLADVAGIRPAPWLSLVPLHPRMLGLDAGVEACVFDLEGVLTDSAALHAWAWTATFDEFLRRFSDRAGRTALPFDPKVEYAALVEGRPRLEGVQVFLRSRGIGLPLGEPDDPSSINTVHALARRKSELLTQRLEREGVSALAGARRYLEAAGRLGLLRAVLSASVRTEQMLEQAGLAVLFEERVDADRIDHEDLRSPPAPDALRSVCRHLGVSPGVVVAYTGTRLGAQAGVAAGAAVVGVGPDAAALLEDGAQRVVPSLTALLDVRLAAGLS